MAAYDEGVVGRADDTIAIIAAIVDRMTGLHDERGDTTASGEGIIFDKDDVIGNRHRRQLAFGLIIRPQRADTCY